MPQELEIKLTLSNGTLSTALAWLSAQPQATSGQVRFLLNTYYDTPDANLNRQKSALRVRQKDGAYIQTVKTQGRFVNGMHEREEWEWPLDNTSLNLSLLRGTPLGTSVDLTALAPVFETNFTRTIVMLDDSEAVIECALDSGVVTAGQQQRQLSEVEFELKSGNPQRLLVWAARLAQECPVFVNLVSKAEQGYYLADLYSPEVESDQHDPVTVLFRRLGIAWLAGSAVNLEGLNIAEVTALAQTKAVAVMCRQLIDQLRGGSTVDELLTDTALGQMQLALLM